MAMTLNMSRDETVAHEDRYSFDFSFSPGSRQIAEIVAEKVGEREEWIPDPMGGPPIRKVYYIYDIKRRDTNKSLEVLCGINHIVAWAEDSDSGVDYSGYILGATDPGRGNRPRSWQTISCVTSSNHRVQAEIVFNKYLNCVNASHSRTALGVSGEAYSPQLGHAALGVTGFIVNGDPCATELHPYGFTNPWLQGSFFRSPDEPSAVSVEVLATVEIESSQAPRPWTDGLVHLGSCESSFMPPTGTLTISGLQTTDAFGSLTGSAEAPAETFSGAGGTFTLAHRAGTFSYTVPAWEYVAPAYDSAKISASGVVLTARASYFPDYYYATGGRWSKSFNCNIKGSRIAEGFYTMSAPAVSAAGYSIVFPRISTNFEGFEVGSVNVALVNNFDYLDTPVCVDCSISGGSVVPTGPNPHLCYDFPSGARWLATRFFDVAMTCANGSVYKPRLYLATTASYNSTDIVTGAGSALEIKCDKKTGLFDNLASVKYSAASGSGSFNIRPKNSSTPFARQPVTFGGDNMPFCAANALIYGLVITIPKVGGCSLPQLVPEPPGTLSFTEPNAWTADNSISVGIKNYYRHMTIKGDGCPIAEIYRQAPPLAGDINTYRPAGAPYDMTDFVTIGNHANCESRLLPGPRVVLTPRAVGAVAYDGTASPQISFGSGDGSTLPASSIDGGLKIIAVVNTGLEALSLVPGGDALLSLPPATAADKQLRTDDNKPVYDHQSRGSSSVELVPGGYYETYIYDRYGNFDGDVSEGSLTFAAQASDEPIFYSGSAIVKVAGCVAHGLGHNGK